MQFFDINHEHFGTPWSHRAPVGRAGVLVADGSLEKLLGGEDSRLAGPTHDVWQGEGRRRFGNEDDGRDGRCGHGRSLISA